MEAWHFKVNSTPEQISQQLESALTSVDGFVLSRQSSAHELVSFKVRKRILYA